MRNIKKSSPLGSIKALIERLRGIDDFQLKAYEDPPYPPKGFVEQLVAPEQHGDKQKSTPLLGLAKDLEDARLLLNGKGQIGRLYQLGSPQLRILLDHAFPNLLVGKTLVAQTRDENLRVIQLGKNKYNDSFGLIIKIAGSHGINPADRKNLIKTLIKLRANELVPGSFIEFLAVLFSVDEKQIYKDLKDE